jgi:hypothetical protein
MLLGFPADGNRVSVSYLKGNLMSVRFFAVRFLVLAASVLASGLGAGWKWGLVSG